MTDPKIIQQVAADFHASGGTFNVRLVNETPIDAEFGIVYTLKQNNKVLYASTETWNNQPQLEAKRGYIYIYSDWRKDEQGNDIAGTKFGDGKSYLINLPFSQDKMYQHMEDTVIHITQEEREFWNNKDRAYVIGTELILTKN